MGEAVAGLPGIKNDYKLKLCVSTPKAGVENALFKTASKYDEVEKNNNLYKKINCWLLPHQNHPPPPPYPLPSAHPPGGCAS